ncbi:MAG TPA: ADYC domain-containing protein [Azospirillaceae bacterium]|nr:ADYC domain-containing protein [Azospirillaceae bacterium]
MRRWGRAMAAGVLGAVLCLPGAARDGAAGGPRLTVKGTEFEIVHADGTIQRGTGVVGATMDLAAADGSSLRLRIDAAWHDPRDADGDVLLYRISVFDPAGGQWSDLCPADQDGLRAALPMAGSWTEAGEHLPTEEFSLSCTGGAQAKCVRLGYKPWKSTPGGASLWKHHQACVRLLRADYCGDGRSHTVDGTAVNIFDDAAIQVRADAGMSFEAGWGPEGAVCLRKVRIPDIARLQDVRAACPRLAAQPDCTEARARGLGALLFNESADGEGGQAGLPAEANP